MSQPRSQYPPQFQVHYCPTMKNRVCSSTSLLCKAPSVASHHENQSPFRSHLNIWQDETQKALSSDPQPLSQIIMSHRVKLKSVCLSEAELFKTQCRNTHTHVHTHTPWAASGRGQGGYYFPRAQQTASHDPISKVILFYRDLGLVNMQQLGTRNASEMKELGKQVSWTQGFGIQMWPGSILFNLQSTHCLSITCQALTTY